LASLPEDARLDLALRLAGEHATGEIEATPAHADVPSALALVRGADEAREAEGKDIIVLGSIEPQGAGYVVQPLAIDEIEKIKIPAEGLDPSALARPSGDAEEATKILEDAALRGQAGAALAEILRRAEAEELVRVTGWPAGVIVVDRTVYVNASWLVAMSALEPEGPPAPPIAPAGSRGPGLAPKSIDGNPYNLPLSLEQCASGVLFNCECASSSQCSHEPADQSFADANAECAWVNSDPVNAEALCVLAIMSVFNVAECVSKGNSSCVPIGDREQALQFLLNENCRAHLDACLDTGKPAGSGSSSGSPSGGSSGGSSGGGSCNNSDCGGSDCGGSDCGGSDCGGSDCGGSNCGGSNCGGSNCGGSNCGSGCKSCRISSGRRASPPPNAPWGDALLVFGPIAYVARRSWRRS
jgi:hypothetical protein